MNLNEEQTELLKDFLNDLETALEMNVMGAAIIDKSQMVDVMQMIWDNTKVVKSELGIEGA